LCGTHRPVVLNLFIGLIFYGVKHKINPSFHIFIPDLGGFGRIWADLGGLKRIEAD
jgi:hypothetical protein